MGINGKVNKFIVQMEILKYVVGVIYEVKQTIIVNRRGINMAHKFQIGDTVQVVKEIDKLNDTFKVGHQGTVIDHIRSEFGYEVQRKNGNTQYFNVKELKLIRKGTK